MFNTLFLKPVRSMPAKVSMNVDGLDMDNIPQHVNHCTGSRYAGNQSHYSVRFFYRELEATRNRSAFYYGVVKPVSHF